MLLPQKIISTLIKKKNYQILYKASVSTRKSQHRVHEPIDVGHPGYYQKKILLIKNVFPFPGLCNRNAQVAFKEKL